MRSRMASANVGSPMTSCHLSRGSWLVISVDPCPHLLAQQRVRHGVIMPLDFDVVIEADPAFLPFRVKIGLDRQLLERGALDLIEQRTPAGPQMPRHAVVDLRDQFPDG